jgi:thiosulfate dehydrogenase
MKERFIRNTILILLPTLVAGSIVLFICLPGFRKPPVVQSTTWTGPDISVLPSNETNNLIRYGEKLIRQTASYFGPKGSVSRTTNGMNCQNCHLDAGTRSFGNSFALVKSTYPKYRPRSGRIETVEFRINECLERSLNGNKIDSNSQEMKAMVAYIKWAGSNLNKNHVQKGTGANKLPYLARAADPEAGKKIYNVKCQRCHSENGDGLMNHDSSLFVYPPLWGNRSFNASAGMHRISQLAGFIKFNMPFDKIKDDPELTDEESWDLAAFVCSQPRPVKFFASDWPDIKSKPVDYPFGPYIDEYTELHHKYGPFQPILAARK